MKKIITITLAFSLMLVLTGCNNKELDTTKNNNDTNSNQVESNKENNSNKDEVVIGTDKDFSLNYLDDGTAAIEDCYLDEVTGTLVIPEKIQGKTITRINSLAFGESDATEIILPDTVTYIEGAAFCNCDNLEKITLGKGLKTVEFMSFNNCPKLKTVTFPEGMEDIDDVPFAGCENLTEVYIPESVTTLGEVLAYLELTPNIVIVTPAGSAAEKVAKANGLPVINP